MPPIYNSRDTAYKQPFGAVKANEALMFTLRVPTAYGCETPYMFIEPDGGEPERLLLQKRFSDGQIDEFVLRMPAGPAGLYWYWFDLWKDYRKLYAGVNGVAVETTGEGTKYQLTVYDPAFTTPEPLHGGVMYQIFPDRFFDGDPGNQDMFAERITRTDKTKEPYYWPDTEEQGYLTWDYFGGDLEGIRQKLPYLQELGVNWIYLNPIFEAHANHRYNTADYMNIDPYLGTNEDFERLCSEALAAGIRIILDGVFSHTGSDSVYFNKEGRYQSYGAWQGEDSPYRDWFLWNPDGTYKSWWDFETLPHCNKLNPSFRHFIAGEGGVVDTWMKRGASGFRLDVADELPDDFIAEIRTAVKRHGADKLLIGEVWEDASNKIAYSERRKYFLGKELDGVMNYPFRDAILRFIGDRDAATFRDSIMSIVENYPPPAMAAVTNHLSTHDTVRVLTAIAGEPLDGHDRHWQSGRRLTPEGYDMGVIRVLLATVLQFTLPGVPCVYYGDEIGMQGYKDPFNRGYFDWNSNERRLQKLIKRLARLRHECAAFKTGGITFTKAENGVLVFERRGAGEAAAIGINCSETLAPVQLLENEVTLPVMGYAIRSGPDTWLEKLDN